MEAGDWPVWKWVTGGIEVGSGGIEVGSGGIEVGDWWYRSG